MFGGGGGGRCDRRRNGAAKDGSDLIDDGAKVVVDGGDGGEIRFRGWDFARQYLNPDGEKTRRRRIDGNMIRSIHGDDGESEGQKRNTRRIFSIHRVLD